MARWRRLGALAVALAAVAAGAFALAERPGDAAPSPGVVLRALVPGMACDGCSGTPPDPSKTDLRDLLGRMPDQSYRVVYDLIFVEQESGLAGTVTVTLAVDLPRVSITFLADEGLDLSRIGQEADDDLVVEFGLYTDGTRFWVCARTVDEAGSCEETVIEPTDDLADLASLLEGLLDQGVEDEPLEAEEVAPREIAGRHGRCFVLAREEAADIRSDVDSTMCVDDDLGVPLSIGGSFDASGDLDGEDSEEEPGGVTLVHDRVVGTWTMEARSISSAVSDADFTPPFGVLTQ